MIETDRAARLQIVDAKLRAGITLFGSAERGEAQNILRSGKELGEAAFKIVIGSHVVEKRILDRQRRQVPAPAKRLRLGKSKVGLIELYRSPFQRQLGDHFVFSDALLDLQSGKVRANDRLIEVGRAAEAARDNVVADHWI